MKENLRKYAWIIALPCLLVLIFIFSGQKEKKLNWSANYRPENKDPYGAYMLYELLNTSNQDSGTSLLKSPLRKAFAEISGKSTPANYFFLGQTPYFGSDDLDSLLAFVEEGNTAFFASEELPANLIDTLFKNCSETEENLYHSDSVVRMNFFHPGLRTQKGYQFETPLLQSRNYYWWGIYETQYCESENAIINLGFIWSGDTLSIPNFIKVTYGKGEFIFHANPIIFTNYHLKTREGFEYTSKALSHLTEGPVYWDDFSRLPAMDNNGGFGESPIRLILENDSLRFAWYFTLILILLYIIFFAKRKQRVIPVLEQNKNTSLEFVKTVGDLYYQQNQHRKLIRLKMNYFLNFIRQRYYLSTQKLDDELIKKVALKSDIPLEEIKNIFKQISIVNRYDLHITDYDLIQIHKSLDYFYKNCK